MRDGLAHRRETADESLGSPEVTDIVMSDLQRKFTHVQWRKHANDEKIRWVQWLSLKFCCQFPIYSRYQFTVNKLLTDGYFSRR